MYYRLVKMAAETECFKLRFSRFKPGTLISDVKRVCVRPFNYFLITKGAKPRGRFLPYCLVLTGIGGVVAPSPLCDL